MEGGGEVFWYCLGEVDTDAISLCVFLCWNSGSSLGRMGQVVATSFLHFTHSVPCHSGSCIPSAGNLLQRSELGPWGRRWLANNPSGGSFLAVLGELLSTGQQFLKGRLAWCVSNHTLVSKPVQTCVIIWSLWYVKDIIFWAKNIYFFQHIIIKLDLERQKGPWKKTKTIRRLCYLKTCFLTIRLIEN